MGFVQQEAALAPRESHKPAAASTSATPTQEPGAGPEGSAAGSGAESLDQAMSRWEPNIKKACDPVAFMTSGAEGNYTAAIYDPRSQAGFFEEAKAALAALGGEMQVFAGGLAGQEKEELLAVTAMLGAWSNLYGAIQNTGMTKEGAADAKARATVYARVRAVVDEAGAATQALVGSSVIDGSVVQSAARAYDEISLFIDSWSDVAATSGKTAASPYMWGAFLQTIERYRSILNQYGKLEERGGDASGTAKLAVKDSDANRGMVQDGERFEEVSEDAGGTMVLALESYNYRAANIVACQKQVAAMLARVEAGEFETAEAAVAAFRANIGAGLASEAFYENVEQLARGAWHTQNGEELLAEGDLAAKQAYRAYKASEESTKKSEASLGKAEDRHERHTDRAEQMDLKGSEKAYEATLAHKARAENHARDAMALAEMGDVRLGDANRKYAEAETEVANAEIALSKVDPDRFPHLAPGVGDVRGKVDALKGDLSESKENAAELDKVSRNVRERAQNAKKIAGDYNPEKHEVECPVVGVEGAELEHFQNFSWSISISPLTWLTIEGGASGEWGTVHNEGGTKSYTEDSAHGGITIDLWLVEFEVGYETKTRYEVDGVKTPKQIEDLGAVEKGKWEAAKEVKESGAQEDLAAAFAAERAAMGAMYRQLGEAASRRAEGGSAAEFDGAVEDAAAEVERAQRDLHMGVMFNSGGSWMQGAIEAGKLPDPEVMEADVLALRDTPSKGLPFEVTRQSDAHAALMRDTREESEQRFIDLAGFKNDPSVSFETTGTWHAGAKASGGGFGIGYQYSRAATVADGEGATFDFEEKVTHTHELSFESPAVDGSVALSLCDGDIELEADADFKVDLGGEEEQKELQQGLKSDLQMLRELFTGGLEPVSLLQLGMESIQKSIERRTRELAPSVETKSGLKASFGLSIGRKKDGAMDGSFSVGFSREYGVEGDAGVFKAEAKYEGGMRVTVPLF